MLFYIVFLHGVYRVQLVRAGHHRTNPQVQASLRGDAGFRGDELGPSQLLQSVRERSRRNFICGSAGQSERRHRFRQSSRQMYHNDRQANSKYTNWKGNIYIDILIPDF